MEKMNQAIKLCDELFLAADQYDLVKQNPERAAALLEVAGLLHSTLEQRLTEHLADTGEHQIDFVNVCGLPQSYGYSNPQAVLV